MSDQGDFSGPDYTGQQGTQTEADFLKMIPGESEEAWKKRLMAAGYSLNEFQGQGTPISQGVPDGTTSWQNQIGKTSGTGNGSTNISGTTEQAMRRGAGGAGGGSGPGGSSYANALSDLMRANPSGGGGGGGGGGGTMDQHSQWSPGMGYGTMLPPQGYQPTPATAPGMAPMDSQAAIMAQNSRPQPSQNALQMLMRHPLWINSAYVNQANPYMGNPGGSMATNYLQQLMRSRQ